jgi:hypothetical protein
MRTMKRHIAANILAVLVVILASTSQTALQAQWCWGYCPSPPFGECVGSFCDFYYTYEYTEWVYGCGWCDLWSCTYVTEFIFGGGCGYECYHAHWRENCSGIPV